LAVVIKTTHLGPLSGAMDATLRQPAATLTADPDQRERISAMVRAHFPLVWRYLRRLGLGEADADDAAQQVFVTVLRKLDRVERGHERAYLLGVALRVAADARKAIRRRRVEPEAALDQAADPAPNPELALERRRRAELLDRLLERLDEDARPVFVLYEVEDLTMKEIAEALAMPAGTVASRLRRARAQFEAAIMRFRAQEGKGTQP
jgi:RNA polymerase sigma-70 factor (ECF subfamily)